jgi:hypothetical protein
LMPLNENSSILRAVLKCSLWMTTKRVEWRILRFNITLLEMLLSLLLYFLLFYCSV